MIKARLWNEEDLKGGWEFTVKLDGVRALWDGYRWTSRRGKILYNMPPFDGVHRDVEVFCTNFGVTIENVRTKNINKLIKPEELYSLDPIDNRLYLGTKDNPEVSLIKEYLEQVIRSGNEGLVLRQGDIWLKVKPYETYDVKVIDQIPGKGKLLGLMGALVTDKGNVGTGFTLKEREKNYIGETVEVYCLQLTEDGFFRHPRFIRVREDK